MSGRSIDVGVAAWALPLEDIDQRSPHPIHGRQRVGTLLVDHALPDIVAVDTKHQVFSSDSLYGGIENADRYIIDRARPRMHMPFGFRIHRCVGSRLGELQLQIIWEEILDRFP
jgi:hypothetical protein